MRFCDYAASNPTHRRGIPRHFIAESCAASDRLVQGWGPGSVCFRHPIAIIFVIIETNCGGLVP